MLSALWKFTKFATSVSCFFISIGPSASADYRHEILRDSLLAISLKPPESVKPLSEEAQIGQALFETKRLSLNGDISCQDCHLDEFGSADGIPVAVGVSGTGKGSERIRSAYRFLSRNTLPLWGRGAPDFSAFFWDGRVERSNGEILSPFGDEPPSQDALAVAAHLPPVEITEMLKFDDVVTKHRNESTTGAASLYGLITEQLSLNETGSIEALARLQGTNVSKVTFNNVAEAISAFIREKFPIRRSRLHNFVFDDGYLTDAELNGGILFFGKGKCANCHFGPHFSDFSYHSIPFPQIGQGKNGFGIDYGRFNVTSDPSDLYKVRTPPLWNVQNTAPYGHTGSVNSLSMAIKVHFDPLQVYDIPAMSSFDRHELYKRIQQARDDLLSTAYLDNAEIEDIVAFLNTLSFEQSP